ncbi:MAG: hypothetical protein H0T92_07395 [Pyrinomonadaceae bacterium]|nr:hypothetical protein [Pyrinomonadaceae bacterium]
MKINLPIIQLSSALCLIVHLLCLIGIAQTPPSASPPREPAPHYEYLWYEAENMRGFATTEKNEPILNPSWMNASRAKAPGWGINGPGVSAEWSQGGESEWNSAAASSDETRASIYQEVEVPQAGAYKLWVRYADWTGKAENFTVRVSQQGREVFRHEFGANSLVDTHDETSMYWGWSFAWDNAQATLAKGPARISIEIEKAAEARRHVDCILVTNDSAFVPDGRRKPPFAAERVLRDWSTTRASLLSLIENETAIPSHWRRPVIAGRDFLIPWNISPEFWKLYDKPSAERPRRPFNAEPVEDFVNRYKGQADVPIFASNLVVPVVYINELPELLQENSSFLRYLRETRSPFAVLINYGTAQMSESAGQAAWKLLNGELREQFIGWISGESIGYVWEDVANNLRLSHAMSRHELLETYRAAYTRALEKKWSALFHTPTGPMWSKLIPAQSTSSTAYAHALGRWGCSVIGLETSAVQPITAMRIAFTRGAARQYNKAFLYYHAPNFGDTATTFTKQQNFAGPDNFFHSRYGATMGPSLSWYRKSYYLYYMAGASAIYLEQGFDQFFKPGPGEHPFQLNPLGRITDEFISFVQKHPDRGTPYTPIAFLLDPAHGWDMTDYPHWPFGVSQINRSDRALRELLGAAYYPALVTEGEPASADRQSFVAGVFGDIFDVLVASDQASEKHSDKGSVIGSVKGSEAIDSYRALVVGGRIEWSREWAKRLEDYVRRGGVVVLNAAQIKGLPSESLGVRSLNDVMEADDARCLIPNEQSVNLSSQRFRYERIALRPGARSLIETTTGDPLITVNRVGRGRIIFCAVPDLLGLDERLVPAAAHLLMHLFTEAMPVRVDGEVQYLINRTERGWIVTLINNRGVFKPQQGMAQVDRSASVEASVSLRETHIEQAGEWTSNVRLDVARKSGSDSVRLAVAPGGLAIVELIERR